MPCWLKRRNQNELKVENGKAFRRKHKIETKRCRWRLELQPRDKLVMMRFPWRVRATEARSPHAKSCTTCLPLLLLIRETQARRYFCGHACLKPWCSAIFYVFRHAYFRRNVLQLGVCRAEVDYRPAGASGWQRTKASPTPGPQRPYCWRSRAGLTRGCSTRVYLSERARLSQTLPPALTATTFNCHAKPAAWCCSIISWSYSNKPDAI